MAGRRAVIVDTNILFSALLVQESTFAEAMLTLPDDTLYICETTLVELFEHKEKLLQISRLSADDLFVTLHLLLRRVNLYKESSIAEENRRQAATLCAAVDPADAPVVALTLELDGLLWTGDKRLRRALEQQGFHRFFAP